MATTMGIHNQHESQTEIFHTILELNNIKSAFQPMMFGFHLFDPSSDPFIETNISAPGCSLKASECFAKD